MDYNLQKESDVKDYIQKLGVEYRFGCYSEKKAEVCHLLGDYLEGIQKDFEKAAKVYKSTCDDYGFAKSCYKFGNYSFLGKGKSGSKGDPQKAYTYYEKGCNLNDPDSCLHSGLLLVSRSVPTIADRNIPKGLDFLTKSCDMNNATACFYLSGMHISGVQNQMEKDMKKAFDFAYKACKLRNMYACANLSQMYARGDGTEKSPEKAAEYKKMAVEMQNEVKKQQQTLGFQQGIEAHK